MQIKHLSALCTLALWSFSVLLLPNVWPMVQRRVPIQSASQYLHCTCKQATYPYNDGQDYQNTKIKLEFKLGWKQLGSNWGFNLRYVWACSEVSILQVKTEHTDVSKTPGLKFVQSPFDQFSTNQNYTHWKPDAHKVQLTVNQPPFCLQMCSLLAPLAGNWSGLCFPGGPI